MAGSEPLIQEADPHITKLALGARMSDKMVQKKALNCCSYWSNGWESLVFPSAFGEIGDTNFLQDCLSNMVMTHYLGFACDMNRRKRGEKT